MNIRSITVMILFALIGVIHAEPKVLTFPENFTWKGIFDQGFRPRHVPSLEKYRAVINDQELIIKYKDKPGFPLGSGRLTFSFLVDYRIRFISHTQKESISLEEAQKKLDLFHEIFADSLQTKGTVPKVIEERSQTLDMLSSKNAWAISNGHNIKFGFKRSYSKRGDVIPSILISLKAATREPRSKSRRREIIAPPEGYENYNMTTGKSPQKVVTTSDKNTSNLNEKWIILICIILLLITVGIIYKVKSKS